MNVGYEQFANAGVEPAVRDYVKAVVTLRRDPLDMDSNRICIEVEAFFRSDWLTVFTPIQGDVLLGYARRIAKDKIMRNAKRCKSCGAFIV